MANFFDVDYNQQSIDLLPPDKRGVGIISIVQSVMKSIQWARDLILGSYKSGATAVKWSPGAYNKYDQVVFNKSLYESLIGNNNAAPTDTTSWRKVLDNFLGVDQRQTFNASHCVLENSLNARFGGTFRMPPSTSNSDIFLSTLPPTISGFVIGQTKGSTVGQTNSSDDIGLPTPFKRANGYQINVPVSIFSLTSEQEIRDFTEQSNAAGIRYIIVQY